MCRVLGVFVSVCVCVCVCLCVCVWLCVCACVGVFYYTSLTVTMILGTCIDAHTHIENSYTTHNKKDILPPGSTLMDDPGVVLV